jgi:uncharacterized membrane protein YdjX (TVP38/TMEM64 family)
MGEPLSTGAAAAGGVARSHRRFPLQANAAEMSSLRVAFHGVLRLPEHMTPRRASTIRWASFVLLGLAALLLIRAVPLERLFGVAQTWIDGLGFWGPLALGAIYVVAALLFVPGSLLTLAAGAIYGVTLGTAIVSLASTITAAVAFLIARHFARESVQRKVRQSPALTAIDDAIGEQGWKIVALLRLSPAVPFGLQNYLYGVTAVRFWPAVLASWLAMLPGTFLYVYLGSLGRSAAAAGETSPAEWALRAVGLAATISVTVYVTRIARRALQTRTKIGERAAGSPSAESAQPEAVPTSSWTVLATAVLAMVVFTFALWSTTNRDGVRQSVERWIGLPPVVAAAEAYEARTGGPVFDHAMFDALLKSHVDSHGWVDYEALRQDSHALDAYVRELARAPVDDLERNEKLALLINAYNAFTLRLILDHYPVGSIRDIPDDKRWDAVRWQIGPYTWSLNQIEHEQIRPKFAEPRIHFALVCAAIGCPPLRNEAYAAARLEQQLAAQAEYVHSQPRWLQYTPGSDGVRLTALYDWYGSDFTPHAPTVLEYAARYAPRLREARGDGRAPRVRYLDYDWRLNDRRNRHLVASGDR